MLVKSELVQGGHVKRDGRTLGSSTTHTSELSGLQDTLKVSPKSQKWSPWEDAPTSFRTTSLAFLYTTPNRTHSFPNLCLQSKFKGISIVFEIPKLIVAKQNNHHNGATLT